MKYLLNFYFLKTLHLENFTLGLVSQLSKWPPNLKFFTSIVTVNVILANCHELKRLGRLDQWGRVDRHQIESIRHEIKARNFDLIIDTGDA